MWFCVRDAEKSLRFYTQTLGCDIAKRRPDLGLVHLRAGTAMIDLVDVNGQLGKKGGDAPDPHRQNVDHLCLRIDPFNEDELLAYLRSQGSPSTLLNRATARKATGHRFTSAIRMAIA